MKYCSNCGAKLEDNETVCPSCQKQIKKVKPKKMLFRWLLCLVTVGAIAIAVIILKTKITNIADKESDSEWPSSTEWIGYAAELEEGRHVKNAKAVTKSGDTIYDFSYDVDGLLTSAYIYKDYNNLAEIAKLYAGTVPIPVEVKIHIDFSTTESNIFEENIAMEPGTNTYSYSNNNNVVEWRNSENKQNSGKKRTYTINPDTGLALEAVSDGSDSKEFALINTVSYMDIRGSMNCGKRWYYKYRYNTRNNIYNISFDNSNGIYCKLQYSTNGRLNNIDLVNKESDANNINIQITYDEAGRVKERRCSVYTNSRVKYIYICKIDYTDDGKLASIRNKCIDAWSLHNDTIISDDTPCMAYCNRYYKYDESGNVRKETIDEFDSVNPQESIYEYDANGNLVRETINKFDSDNTQKSTNINEYDTNGNPLSEQEYTFYGGNPYITSQTEYKYNEHGQYAKKYSSYQYEANSDFSIVNQINADEGEWGKWNNIKADEKADEKVDKTPNIRWEITYYTDEEIQQYLHDKEFKKL